MVKRYGNFVRTKSNYRSVTLMQEVCGAWGPRKRLVERSASQGCWRGESGCAGGQGNWETGQGDKCGRGDVGCGGREAQRRRRMVRRW
jgi:hypothetical protein